MLELKDNDVMLRKSEVIVLVGLKDGSIAEVIELGFIDLDCLVLVSEIGDVLETCVDVMLAVSNSWVLVVPRDVELRGIDSEDEVGIEFVVVVWKVSEIEEPGVAVMDSPLVLEDVTGGPGGIIDVVEDSTLVEVDADVDRVIASGNEVVSDAELSEDDGVIVGTLEVSVVIVDAEAEGVGGAGWTEEFGYEVVAGTLEVLK